VPVETDDAKEKDAYRQFPANFMVFTSGVKTPQDLRSVSVYKCFAHVSTKTFNQSEDTPIRPRLLGIASDTMPWNALQKTRRVGVTVRGAVTVAVNKDELAACQIGDLLEYKYDPTPVKWMGLADGFRTARIARHIAPKPIFSPGMSIGQFKEQIMTRGGPKQFAQTILDIFTGGGTDVANFYQARENCIMRMPPPDDSMDWVRDCLGVDFDGPTAWDRHMNLHRSHDTANFDGAPRRGYRGWLADYLDDSATPRSSVDIGGVTSNQEIFNNGSMDPVYRAWHQPGEFRLVPSMALNSGQIAMGTNVVGNALMALMGTTATDTYAYVLESAVCDGRCGVLGRLLEKVS